METIKNYLENLFSQFPETSEIKNLKYELSNNMEDKYNELKNNGKSENEAIGIVISEFGNIDELVDELGIKKENTQALSNDLASLPIVEIDEAYMYLETKKKTAFYIALGTFLCIIGAASTIIFALICEKIFLITENDAMGIFVIVPLFLLIALAVALFIYSGSLNDKFKYIAEGDFISSTNTKNILSSEFNIYKNKSTKAIILAVILCILSPLSTIVCCAFNETIICLGVILTLVIVACAVFIFINYCSYSNAYKQLLQIEDYAIQKRSANKIIGSVAGVFWPVIVAIYLFISFMFHAWNISWIIFPIAGILFGAFSSLFTALNTTNQYIKK